jgi:hypothetical protein
MRLRVNQDKWVWASTEWRIIRPIGAEAATPVTRQISKPFFLLMAFRHVRQGLARLGLGESGRCGKKNQPPA